jgi:hypothetical protein
VTAEDRERVIPRPQGDVWETPLAEEIRVSPECSAYMGAWKDQDWM